MMSMSKLKVGPMTWPLNWHVSFSFDPSSATSTSSQNSPSVVPMKWTVSSSEPPTANTPDVGENWNVVVGGGKSFHSAGMSPLFVMPSEYS